MQIQVIHLDPEDDIISIRDKMKWVKIPRLLLMFPKKTKLLGEKIDLVMIKRQATASGIQVGLVTMSRAIRRSAQVVAIPVFASADEAEQGDWAEDEPPPVQRRKPRPDLRQMREMTRPIPSLWVDKPVFRISILAVVVIVLLALLAVFLPSATITLSPAQADQSMELSLSASEAVSRIDLAGVLPAKKTSIYLEASKSVAITASAMVPDAPAEGVVRFTNQTLAVVGIPAGTVVRTEKEPSLRFFTLQDGVLSAVAGKTLDIPVRAVNPGTSGNLPAGSLVVIEGGLGASLSANNPEPTSGGTDRSAALPTSENRARLRAALLSELRQMARQELEDTLEEGSLVFPESINPVGTLIEEYEPKPGAPGERLTLTLRGEFAAAYSAGSDVIAFGNAVLDASLAPDTDALPATLAGIVLHPPVTDESGITRFQIRFTRKVIPRLDMDEIATLVKGKPRSSAKQVLQEKIQLQLEPEISILPSFWWWLPATEMRIVVIFK